MFIGHYGIAYLLKRRFKNINQGLLFASVQLIDILAFIFILLGIEQISYYPDANPFLRTKIEFLPFSHSLFTDLILSFLVFLILFKLGKKTWGIVLAIGVLSHWFLDLIVHISDLPLFFNSYKVGFGLWQYPVISFSVEIALVIFGIFYLYKDIRLNKRSLLLIVLLLAGFWAMFFKEEPPIIHSDMKIRALILLIPYLGFIALAFWSDKKINKQKE